MEQAHTMLQEVLRMQSTIYDAVVISNWLAVIGRLLEIGIGVMLALVLGRLRELCRRERP